MTTLADLLRSQPCDPAAEAFAAEGGRVRIGRIITGAPGGEVRFTAVVADGAVTYEADGGEVDVSFSDTYVNAIAILQGALDPNAAFMRGQTKVTGPTSLLLAVLAASRGSVFDDARRSVVDQVEI